MLERDDGLSEQIPSHSNEVSVRMRTCAKVIGERGRGGAISLLVCETQIKDLSLKCSIVKY